MTTASAPGKIILFGEHAVVSGTAALGGAADLRARATVEDLPGRVLIETDDLSLQGFSFDPGSGQISSASAAYATRYVSAAVRELEARDVRIRIESDIPPAAGMGSSASIVVAAVAALNGHLGLGLSEREIAQLSYRIERGVQKGRGSPMDTALATYGGYQRIADGNQPLDLPPLEVMVGYTRVPHDTFSLVERVQLLKERYPDLVEPIFQAMGAITERAVPLVREMNLDELGGLMDINHGLLEALGVSSRELSELVYAARGAGGALGAKLTGAGGGGCMIALPGIEGKDALMVALRQARGVAFPVMMGGEGVRLEGD
ncbi:MAG TPA: mevalonate kinase [Methanothrix sp.]|jgi:mevalonate kinase|uniref:mevalonate kinase n=1 Tax=Methanothrix sp. TaxID=90426 RepID=UPI002C7D9D13|nr:mevalonate kinase [Methanothrix sp.]MDI9417294.1 mevalonate kinase [Euryarchaeota archaeon]HON35937.1 mevalonate kinase [Methanothrix sp.]HRU75246.1 mevalonate kinase [Methanothrix sp.]